MPQRLEDMEVTLPDLGQVAVRLRRSPRARKLRLKIDPYRDGVEVVLPRGASRRTALGLLETHSQWVGRHLQDLPERVDFLPGAWVPVLGIEHAIRRTAGTRGGVYAESGIIWVSGAPEHTSRRVRDWLKKRARAEIAPRLTAYAGRLGHKIGRLSLRDTRSRWASCSARGTFSFSWRLVMAPERVLDYVIAHEAAHLVELNHSPRYWRLVAELFGPCRAEQDWLKRHGIGLHRYGPPAT